jgi:hypothetical protein
VRFFTGALYGEGGGPVYIDQLFCNSNDVVLSDCKYLFLNECSHSRDVSIACNGRSFYGFCFLLSLILYYYYTSFLLLCITFQRMFLNAKCYHFMFKCWILLKAVLGAWTVVCTLQYRTWTGLIKPSLQHFHFCPF